MIAADVVPPAPVAGLESSVLIPGQAALPAFDHVNAIVVALNAMN